jgi:hypothetical protein
VVLMLELQIGLCCDRDAKTDNADVSTRDTYATGVTKQKNDTGGGSTVHCVQQWWPIYS